MPVGPSDTCRSPKTPKQQDRWTRILGSARTAFAENSFHDVLMDDVARAAGVGKGTIYRYFPDKEALYFAVIFSGVEDLKRRIESTVLAQCRPEEAICELVNILVSFLTQNRFFFRLMNIEDSKVGGENTPNRKKWQKERGKLIGAIARLLEQARDAGALHAAHPRTDAHILMGMVRAALRYNQDNLTPQQISDEISRIYLHGIRRKG